MKYILTLIIILFSYCASAQSFEKSMQLFTHNTKKMKAHEINDLHNNIKKNASQAQGVIESGEISISEASNDPHFNEILENFDYEANNNFNNEFEESIINLMAVAQMRHDHNLSLDKIPSTQHDTQIFGGQKLECVDKHLKTKCCKASATLLQKTKVTSCSKKNKEVMQKHSDGLCHYVGSYSTGRKHKGNKRNHKVYCCYQSQLAKEFQEQARQQLGMRWGKARTAQCGGLSIDVIQKLNLEKMDMSQAYKFININPEPELIDISNVSNIQKRMGLSHE